MFLVVFDTIFSFLFAAAKFLLRILTYFGLIIPVFYFLLFHLIDFFIKEIELVTVYHGWYIGGMIVSFVLCVLYFVLKVLLKKEKPPQFSWRKKEKNQQNDFQNEQSPLVPSGNIIQERVFRDPNGNIVQERTFQLPDSDKYKSYPLENNTKPPEIYENKYGFKALETPKAQLKIVDSHNETPEIYRVKNNRQFIIKEYSDRVEVYKETANGYEFVKCDYK